MPDTLSYQNRRGQLLQYFDRTAADAWNRLTSDVPVSGVRATVREGRRQMRAALLSWLPQDMHGLRVLDAGCGTCALAAELADRGADVLAIDLSPTLVQLGEERYGQRQGPGRIQFAVGDFADPRLGSFDHVVAMDSLIHYRAVDVVRALEELAPRTRQSLCITVTPSNPLLLGMLAMGRLFPRSDRSPAVVPVDIDRMRTLIHRQCGPHGLYPQRNARIGHFFYTSHALEIGR